MLSIGTVALTAVTTTFTALLATYTACGIAYRIGLFDKT